MVRVVVIDVSDDYRVMKPPLPSECYPVLTETWIPVYRLQERLPEIDFVSGYLYDWHEASRDENGVWYVGVVTDALLSGAKARHLVTD